ncbi:MAG: hypothetical protein HQK67_00215 [Desulfamplus sp.]|nr:hypothetical protein [Desulfamplus sp.]
MEHFTTEQIESKKKAIFDTMGKRGQKQVVKIGYDKWDPIQNPKDPIDIRKDKGNRTTQTLIREFLQQSTLGEEYSNSFAQGAFEMCLGIINENEKTMGMFEFAKWYSELLKKEGHK